MPLIGVVVMLLLVAALSGCGDERTTPSATATAAATTTTSERAPAPAAAPASDRARARRALVRLEDFPVGWGKVDVPVPDVRCGATNPYEGARTISGSKRILYEHTGVQETVVLFQSQAASSRAFARMNAPNAMRCLRRNVRGEVSAEAGAQASPLEVARVEKPERWEKATRFSATAPSSIGRLIASIDAVHLRVGRGLAALVIVSGTGPVDEALYEKVIRLFSRRLHAALA